MRRRASQPRERILEMAEAFLDEVRRDLERATSLGCDLPPRLRSVHSRPGHATPEYRTLAIPPDPTGDSLSPETLSQMIARYAALKPPSCVMLAMDGTSRLENGDECPVLIAEVRDNGHTRAFWMQRYRTVRGKVAWEQALEGGWQEPAENEMILDLAFSRDMDLPIPADTAEAPSGQPKPVG